MCLDMLRHTCLQANPTNPTPQVPKLVERYMAGETKLDDYITHELPFNQVWPLLHLCREHALPLLCAVSVPPLPCAVCATTAVCCLCAAIGLLRHCARNICFMEFC